MKKQSIEALNTAVEYMDNIFIGIEQITNGYISGEEANANNTMLLLIDGLDWINKVLVLTKEFHSINSNELNEVYYEIFEAVENNDTVLISDLLDYEIKPKIQEWQEILKKEVGQYVS
ncbi:hypothetical protein [Tepidibacter aestuarii]|uniref:hypothetical protein n=1 Tax=Tepidibacter aestuarii TaxID=2925782 RepID=UPI0020C0EEE2|nr:hypothetical protein [Tepidibacter aestuarii]CAH2211900.1 conserved protein of unknown function [Tepidibacter aestuarii]